MGLFDIFKKKDRVIEDFDNALKKGIITEEEYKILVEKYRLGIIGYYKEQLTSGSITKVEYKDKYDEFIGRKKSHQEACNASFAVTSLPGIDKTSIFDALNSAIIWYYSTDELSEKDYEKIANKISYVSDNDLIFVFRILKIFGDLSHNVQSVNIHLGARLLRQEQRFRTEKAIKEHEEFNKLLSESARERKQIINDYYNSRDDLRDFVLTLTKKKR